MFPGAILGQDAMKNVLMHACHDECASAPRFD